MATAKLFNLARVTTATTGTGTLTLGAAVSGFLTFAQAGVSDGDTVSYAIKDGSNSEIGRGVYTASGTTLTRSVLKSTNSNNAINLSGTAEVFITPSAADLVASTQGSFNDTALINGTLVPSVSGNALTIAVKTLANADPSANDPVLMAFRSATASSGAYNIYAITSALSVTVPSSQAVGTSNNVPFRIWCVGIDNGGTPELAVINCVTGGATPTAIASLQDDAIISTTAIASAPSAAVFYSTTARSSKPMRILGYVEYSSGLATAGTWGSAPTKAQLFGPGIKLPGDIVQTVQGTTTTSFVSSSTSYVDSGIQASITLSSAANINKIRAGGGASPQSNGVFVIIAIHRDTTITRGIRSMYGGGGPQIGPVYVETLDAPGDTSSHTYKARMKNTSGTNYFPYCTSGEDGIIIIEEIMA